MKIAHLSDIHVMSIFSSYKAILKELIFGLTPQLLLRTYNPLMAATVSLVIKNVLNQRAFPVLPHIVSVYNNYRYLSENFQRLINDLNNKNPDFVVITGDLTTTARAEEFQEAKEILQNLIHYPDRLMIVAGNHDRINLSEAERIENYFPFVKNGISEVSLENKLSVIGMDSTVDEVSVDAFIATNTKGKFDLNDINTVRQHFSCLPRDCVKILTTHHHPYNLPERDFEEWGDMGRWVAKKYMGPGKHGDLLIKCCQDSRVNLLLFGHKHIPTQRQEGSLMMACSNAVTHQFERGFMTYRMFDISNHNISTEWIKVPAQVPAPYDNTAELAESLRDIETLAKKLVKDQATYGRLIKIDNELDKLIEEQVKKIPSSSLKMKDAIDKL